MRTRSVKPRSASRDSSLETAEVSPGAVEWEDVVPAEAAGAEAEDEAGDPEAYGIFRVGCPDCAQPIALLEGEGRLPEHALCSAPWNPFWLTVCEGSGRPVDEAVARDGSEGQREGLTALLTLPEGLDWRMQPFSHPGDAGGDVERAARPARRQKPARA